MKRTVASGTVMQSVAGLGGLKLGARDGDLGKVRDCLFDDRHWGIRYLVADTSKLFGREVVLYTDTLGIPDWDAGRIPVELTAEQIKQSPGVDLDQPVSRQHLLPLHQYYGWPLAWDAVPGTVLEPDEKDGRGDSAPSGDPHLRSSGEVTGYGIEAGDGAIGHVEDFIAEIHPWVIRYAVVDTRNWLPGRKVLVSPLWIDRIDWASRKVHVGLDREAIRESPPFDSSQPVNREYEVKLHDYYGRPVYWR